MKKPLGDELAGNTTKIEISGSETSASIWFGKSIKQKEKETVANL
jgi:hypothetical protein